MKKIEHIGIAVKDIEASNQLFTAILGEPPYKSEVVESEGVTTSFFQVGPNKIELLEATNPESPIAKFIEKRGIVQPDLSIGPDVLNSKALKANEDICVLILTTEPSFPSVRNIVTREFHLLNL